jgi:hypothetical protein
MGLERLTREEFLTGYFDYRPGQHLALIEPTGGGKTRLKYQLLQQAMAQNPELGVKVTIPKRRDSESAAWNRALGLAETPVWPPAAHAPWREKPPGYAVWPKHLTGSPGQDPMKVLAADREHVAAQMRAAALDSFQHGNCVHDCDDLYTQAVILGMNELFSEILRDGRSSMCGLWGADQKPSGTREGSVTSFFYNAPSWLFLGLDLDERNRERFGEIGGVDRKYVSETVMHLPIHQFGKNAISDKLVICKAAPGPYGPAMCILGP